MAITSIAGIWIRPRKKKTGRDRSVTLRFALEGPVPSKKNNQVPIMDFREADRIAGELFQKKGTLSAEDYKTIKRRMKARIVPNSRHQKWHLRASESIIAQRDKQQAQIALKGLIFPLSNCSVSIYHYKMDRKRRDLGNRLMSIEDLLVDCHVIIDDSDEVLAPILLDGDKYIDEITKHCTVIHLTAYY
jgi:Holliday junction resolvase RusA-like endonuclease